MPALLESAPVFAALGDKTRLALVLRLTDTGPRAITELAAHSNVSRQAITKHLEVLESAGLVSDSRRGRERIWEVEAKRFEEASEQLAEISKRWDQALARLKALVEDTL